MTRVFNNSELENYLGLGTIDIKIAPLNSSYLSLIYTIYIIIKGLFFLNSPPSPHERQQQFYLMTVLVQTIYILPIYTDYLYR